MKKIETRPYIPWELAEKFMTDVFVAYGDKSFERNAETRKGLHTSSSDVTTQKRRADLPYPRGVLL